MKLYEKIDHYIAEHGLTIGDQVRARELQTWFEEMDWETNASTALQVHRLSPTKRTFTLKRVGMGPNSYHELVADEDGLALDAVMEMHQQQTVEMVSRWGEEARNRMAPLLRRDEQVMARFDKAMTQMRLVASVFDQDIQEILDELTTTKTTA